MMIICVFVQRRDAFTGSGNTDNSPDLLLSAAVKAAGSHSVENVKKWNFDGCILDRRFLQYGLSV